MPQLLNVSHVSKRDALIAEIHKQDQEDRDNESEKF